MTPIRIAVTGAAGQIGYSLVYRIAAGDVFGDRPVELRLLDLPQAVPALAGVAMELEDCASPVLAGIEVGDDPRRIFDGVNVALLVGASPRKAGMERSDLLKANGAIFASQGKALAAAAASDLRVVVTGNPANTNALIAQRNADGVPPERFTALTRLDHDRAVSLLARKARRRPSDVTRMTIWGNHSTTQYPDVFNARICGRPAMDWVDDGWVAFDYIPQVARRGGGGDRRTREVERGLGGPRDPLSRQGLVRRHARRWLDLHGGGERRFVRDPRGAGQLLPRHCGRRPVVDRAGPHP